MAVPDINELHVQMLRDNDATAYQERIRDAAEAWSENREQSVKSWTEKQDQFSREYISKRADELGANDDSKPLGQRVAAAEHAANEAQVLSELNQDTVTNLTKNYDQGKFLDEQTQRVTAAQERYDDLQDQYRGYLNEADTYRLRAKAFTAQADTLRTESKGLREDYAKNSVDLQEAQRNLGSRLEDLRPAAEVHATASGYIHPEAYDAAAQEQRLQRLDRLDAAAARESDSVVKERLELQHDIESNALAADQFDRLYQKTGNEEYREKVQEHQQNIDMVAERAAQLDSQLLNQNGVVINYAGNRFEVMGAAEVKNSDLQIGVELRGDMAREVNDVAKNQAVIRSGLEALAAETETVDQKAGQAAEMADIMDEQASEVGEQAGDAKEELLAERAKLTPGDRLEQQFKSEAYRNGELDEGRFVRVKARIEDLQEMRQGVIERSKEMERGRQFNQEQGMTK